MAKRKSNKPKKNELLASIAPGAQLLLGQRLIQAAKEGRLAAQNLRRPVWIYGQGV